MSLEVAAYRCHHFVLGEHGSIFVLPTSVD
jgi:hypothetical protein